jgi:hypothetical protein
MREAYFFLISMADREINELSNWSTGLRVMRCCVSSASVYEKTLAALEDCSCQSCNHEASMRFWLRQSQEARAKLAILLAE